ncbi:nucleoside-triphosphate diphosphatase [Floricoccus penangensis]|uniref:nucleoside-triphosphate diphosphatase n=1 Tax=Floricoccus penangensis TaxID=1859475 RepID=UPI0009F6887B|nr:nucleoside-triphosphate diphosphatase [Floricoccus penangensis]
MSQIFKDVENNVFGKLDANGFLLIHSFEENFREKFLPIENFFKKFFEDNDSESFGIEIFSVEDKTDAVFDLFFEMVRTATGKDFQYQLSNGVFSAYLDGKLIHLETYGDFDSEKLSDTLNLKPDFVKKDKKYQISEDKTILIATHNEGKTKEFRQMFSKLGYTVENLNDYPELPEVEENGSTFEANARLKAETISELTGKMVLADDSGLKVDVLGGLPGVWSARFAGDKATDAANNAKLLHELSSTAITPERRTAQFHTTLVVAAPGKESLVVEADWDGYIATIPKGENGFGYDPLFEVGETGKTAAQLPLEEKNKISHRAKALEKLLQVWGEWAK